VEERAEFNSWSEGRDFLITRVLAAPRAQVFAAWTDATLMARWFGPHGMAPPHVESDPRPGGVLKISLRAPDGQDYRMTGEYREVVAPERLVYTNDLTDHPASWYAAIDRERPGRGPVRALATVTFAEHTEGTLVTVRSSFESEGDRNALVKTGMADGWRQTFERLLAVLSWEAPGPAFEVERTFAAPRTRVFDAWCKPEHLAHWWGPKGFALEIVTLDFRPGGVFHYGMHGREGTPMAGHAMWGRFTYFAIDAPSRLVFVNGFADATGNLVRHPMSAAWPLLLLNTVMFEEKSGGTTVRLRAVPYGATAEERATFEAGFDSMRGGFGGTFDQLTEYLAAFRRTEEGTR
jgi:uncharacterized protein YndB with AHSA1/START domain